MLRIALLFGYFTYLSMFGLFGKAGGGLDPFGQPATEAGGGTDPNGRVDPNTKPPYDPGNASTDHGSGLDPLG